MKYVAHITFPTPLRLVIERQTLRAIDGGTDMDAFYIYVYDGDKMIYDYLQDTLEIAMSFSHKKFGVPLDSWTQTS